MPRPAVRLTGAAAGITPVLIALLILSSTSPFCATSVQGRHAPLVTALSGPCLGASAPGTATGALVLVGSSTPLPDLSGVPVTVDYFYTEKVVIGINVSTESCVATSASNVTGPGGSVSVSLPIPSERCTPTCYVYTGPYGPLGYETSGAPDGFVEQDPASGTSPGTIDWYADLYSVTLNLTGTDDVSTNAPVEVSALAWNAEGAPAPGPLTFSWSLGGLGWTPPSQTGPNATVAGSDSGWVGSLSVTVTGTFGSTVESTQSAVLSLLPVPTRVLNATPSTTPVDPGVPVTFDVTGSGAVGYSYSATVDPGLGAAPVSGACESSRLPNGTANLTCQVRAAYPVSGIALPTASISNGYSTGEMDLSPVSVHPVEQVTLSSPSLVTYPNRTIAVTVNVTNGTGSAPYGPACLSGDGRASVVCQFQNATSWIFDVDFPTPGEYELRASVTDRFGENISASAGVLVVPFLSARANGSASISLFANQTKALSVIVAGGALPIVLWWNLSRTTAFSCPGFLDFYGTIDCAYESASIGSTNLTVTLRDALGSETSVVFHLNVSAAPRPPGPSGGSLFSGTTGWILFGVLIALALSVLLVVAADVRRRHRMLSAEPGGERVEETELERMARGRDHLLARAAPTIPRRPDELVAGWTGPPVRPEEWAEWIAALVADGSLIPSRAYDGRLVYRRAAPRPRAPTIQYDPTALPSTPGPEEELEPSSGPPGPQGGG